MLVTLDLITTNIYNSVKAPEKRNFSYIEIWMFLVYIPIFIAILEYGIILTMKKYIATKIAPDQNSTTKLDFDGSLTMKNGTNFDELSKTIDFWTFWAISFIIITGNVLYWLMVFRN